MDKTTPSNKVIFRHKPQRGVFTDMDLHLRLPACSNHHLSLTLFEKVPINELLANQQLQITNAGDDKQLKLFDL
jgi:hypothetical protein